jgi:hypothetical protein
MKRTPAAPPSSLLPPSLDVAAVRWSPLDAKLLDSGICAADLPTRWLWVAMILLASERGAKGNVDITTEALARRANLPLEETERALAALMAPDPLSRTLEAEGRRIVPLDPVRPWGWRVVAWEDGARARHLAQTSLRVEKHRAKKRAEAALTAPERK